MKFYKVPYHVPRSQPGYFVYQAQGHHKVDISHSYFPGEKKKPLRKARRLAWDSQSGHPVRLRARSVGGTCLSLAPPTWQPALDAGILISDVWGPGGLEGASQGPGSGSPQVRPITPISLVKTLRHREVR